MKKKCLLALLIALLMCMGLLPVQAEEVLTAPALNMVVKVEGPDTQELLDGFALREMYGMRGVATWGVTARRTLSEPMKGLYDALKPELEKIAIGQRSSTVFTFTAEEMAEMGFYTVFEYSNGADFMQKVDLFMEQVSNQQMSQLLTALLLDCPYDMYWYNQTGGMGLGSGSITGSGGVGYVDGVTLTMPVSAVFQGESENHVAVKWGTSAVAAGEKAAAIIAAAEDMPDHEKLNYYAEQIMDLVAYNDDAAAGMDSYYASVDANPWQLIYVFDGDPSTNVVCEGYSKAFQYLCDMTLFDSDDIRCITVTGLMGGGTGAGGHMWNIVRMEDGKNYIVDVTNSEVGTAGDNSALMLGGSTVTVAADEDWGNGYKFATVPETTFLYAKNLPYTAEDLTLAGSKYVPKYYVTFDANGAAGTMAEQSVEQGQQLALSANGFTPPVGGLFVGWNTKADGTGTAYAAGANVTPAGNMTLFAQWKMAAASVTSGGIETLYEDLDDAYADAKDGDTITLLQDIDLGGSTFAVEKDITLAGKSLAGNDPTISVENANLTLKDISIVINGEAAGVSLGAFGSVTIYDDVTFVSDQDEERQDILLGQETSRIVVAENRTSPVCLAGTTVKGVVAVPGEGVTLSVEDFSYPEKYNSLFVKEADGSIGLYYDLSKAAMEIDYDSIEDFGAFFTYSGSEITPPVVVKHCPDTDNHYVNGLEEGVGYTLAYENNINAGEDSAKTVATGIGEYRGTREVAFSIQPASAYEVGQFEAAPEAGAPLPVLSDVEHITSQVTWSPAPVANADGELVADFATQYTAGIHYMPVENYQIDGAFLELPEGYLLTSWNEDGTIDVEVTFPATRNRALNSLAKPEDSFEADAFCGTEADVLQCLPTQLMGEAETLNGDLEDVTLPITWVIHDFNPSPLGEMTLSWTVDVDALAKYTVLEDVVTTDVALFTNGPGVDPVIEATPVYLAYEGQELPVEVDVSQCFTVTGGNGSKTYSLVEDVDFATLDGTTLSINRPGTVLVMIRVSADGKYYEGTSLCEVTLTKGTPDVEVPTGMTGPYGYTLGDVAFSDSGWSWAGSESERLDFEGEERFFSAIYTPEDTTWWNTIEAQVGVTPVRTALTISGTGEAYGQYGDALGDLVISGPSVTDFQGNSIVGNWAFVENAENPSAGTHTYQAVFTPYEDVYQPLAPQDVTVTIQPLCLADVMVPEDEQLTEFAASADDAIALLPQTIVYLDENGAEFPFALTWEIDTFDAHPGAANEFFWSVAEADMKNFAPLSDLPTSGSITVTNADSLPVSITAKDATVTYDGATYDVSALFAVDENAGAKTYAVVSGDATLSGTTLTIVKAGQIKIRLSTAANDPYAAAQATATLTVRKGDPLVSAPLGLTATYGQTLADVALPTASTGAWSWADSTASVGDAGVNQHKAVFTPNDTDNWNPLTLDADVTVSKATVGFGASIKVLRGEEETSTFTYGEVATVKAEVKPVTSSVMAARVAPGKNQMALFLGEKQVSDAADPVDGVYTLTVDTKAKELPVGVNKLKLKYVGTDNVTDAEAEVSITVNAKPLTATAAKAADRAYIPGSKQVAVTEVTLEGALPGDDVKVSLTGLKGAVASEDAGEYEEVSLTGLSLTGADAAFYTVADAAVPAKVTITKAIPEVDPGVDPAPAKPYEPGITLGDAAPSLPVGTFDVPGKLRWDVPAETVIEPGKSYSWTFQPDDADNYQPVKGESVIYPMGEKPEITGPAAPETANVVEGSSATFTVTAKDAETYQWQVNKDEGGFEDIAGANGSSYTTGPLTPAENGYRYRCVVMNNYGTAVSPEFTVTVTEKPNIPVTGDRTNLVLLFALTLMSLTAMGFMAFRRKES